MWRVLLGLLLFSSVNAEERLRLHGSNTIGEALAPALAEAWLQREGFDSITRHSLAFEEIEIRARRGALERVVEVHAHGSSTGFADLAVDRADIALSSRPVKPAERDLHPRLARLDRAPHEVVLALDGLALIVHPDNPVASLDRAQLRDIFVGRLRDWSQLDRRLRGGIELHARDDRSGTYDSFRSLVLGELALDPAARRYESTEQLARAVAADRLAIGFVGLAGTRVNGVRALTVSDGGAALPPSVEEVAVEDYPLSRRLYLYLPEQALPLARQFADFALTELGQAEVERAGFVAQEVRSYRYQPRPDAPAEYLDLVHGAERLSLNFRFGAGSSLLDDKIYQDLDRLAGFMLRPENRARPLILVGFSDAVETFPAMALFLSTDRADLIATLLVQRGVDPWRVRGLGGAAAIASNDDDLERQRNRRVEVWIGAPAAGRGLRPAP